MPWSLSSNVLAAVRHQAGPRGQDGLLQIRAERISDRTRLSEVFSRPPLQVMRAAYTEPDLPDLAAVTICSPAGGVLQGDRLRTEIDVEAAARLRLETQSATRIYATPDAAARAEIVLRVGAGAFLEYVPDPLIPYAAASYRQESLWEVEESAMLVVGEVVAAGREARGEWAAYERVETEVEARRPDGRVLFRDACRLVPAPHPTLPRGRGREILGLLGGATAIGSIFVVAPGFRSGAFDFLGENRAFSGCQAGWSDLPSGAGAWFKVLAPDSAAAAAAVRTAWAVARRTLLGCGLPPIRRF
jgi:urease accessory protein